MSSTSIVTAITPDEARSLTDRIRAAAEHLHSLLLEAHEREAWRALGYPTWRAYATAEFGMSQSHAYRLLDHGRVVRALEQAAGSPIGEISELAAREIKPHLADVTTEIHDRIKAGEAGITAVNNVINLTRNRYAISRRREDQPNRIVEQTVGGLRYALEGLYHEDDDYCTHFNDELLADIDLTLVPTWVAELREASKAIVTFADRLDAEARRRTPAADPSRNSIQAAQDELRNLRLAREGGAPRG